MASCSISMNVVTVNIHLTNKLWLSFYLLTKNAVNPHSFAELSFLIDLLGRSVLSTLIAASYHFCIIDRFYR